jgi:hypothetical protein
MGDTVTALYHCLHRTQQGNKRVSEVVMQVTSQFRDVKGNSKSYSHNLKNGSFISQSLQALKVQSLPQHFRISL